MEIKISRHARRRMDLYHIEESDVIETITLAMKKKAWLAGKKITISQDFLSKYGFRLKVVRGTCNNRRHSISCTK